MLQSFYRYIVENLIIGFFRENPVVKGSRYYIIIENDEYRDGFLSAIKNISNSISISDIYQGSESFVAEESYNTYYIQVTPNQPGIIIGYDKTATEDYLTTMRNAIGVTGSKYENYAVLYILSNSGLSSIVTACQNLQGKNGPLHSKVIIDSITKQAEEKIQKDFELMYLRKYLEQIADYIADGTCNLFDFQNALGILQNKELKGHFTDIDFFSDDSIYESSFSKSDSEMIDRISKNQELFHRVNDIMLLDEEDEKLKLLQKFLDEKQAKTILNSDDWKADTKFQNILDSIEIKQKTTELELIDVRLVNSSLMTSMIYTNNKKGSKKKTTNNIIICDQSEAEAQPLKLTFNKDIKKSVLNKDCKIIGSTITMNVKDTFIRQTVGFGDNHHDFFVHKINIARSFFKNIENYFIISKNGEIVVSLPDCESVSFGDGAIKVTLPITRKIEWNNDYTLEIPIADYDGEEKIDFTLSVDNKEYKINMKLFAAKPLLPIGPDTIHSSIWDEHRIYHGIISEDTNFYKIQCEEEERSILKYWRWYLDVEQLFIKENAYRLVSNRNSITNEVNYEPAYLNLPDEVKDALDDIYKYYREHNTVPSLCYLDDELENLYIKYWITIKNVISNIHNDRSLNEKEHAITKLGIVEDWNRIYLSPFHPIMIAYMLEFKRVYDCKDKQVNTLKLLTPFYLIPYLSYNDKYMRPYSDTKIDKVTTWLSYECVNSKPQERANNITKEMVTSKMMQFTKHFSYLFQDKDCPIIISSIGINDDTNVIIGIIEYIKKEYKFGIVQKIELHEYVNNLMDETFFEKLNRLNAVDSITREFEKYDISLESINEYTNQEIIHQLFTRVSFYKHVLKEDADAKIGYCHIAFYQMNTGNNFITPGTNDMRIEMSLNGLISIPSTCFNNDSYYIGFGTKGLKESESGFIYPMAICMNNLYANEKNNGASLYHSETAVVKRYKFCSTSLLESIYDSANWVTFLNPEVDINFFYRQDLYIVHYTDQYTINAKYDSITVTKHVSQYENMLSKSYEKYSLSDQYFVHFNKMMMNYFNCLNGTWMLSIVNKTEMQIREKMSVVASCIAMLKFMRRTSEILWIPVSLDEILRVTGSIGLSQEYIFTKKMLNVKGAMSDDLLMIGLDKTNTDNIKLYMYPVEVKMSKNNAYTDKGMKQVAQTYTQIREHIFGEDNFTKKIYRTFFASQYLTNAEKLRANNLISDDIYKEIDKYRYDLLNLNFSLGEVLPIPEMGHAALVSFYSTVSHSLETVLEDGVAVCQIHFSEKEAFKFVADPNNANMEFLENDTIIIEDSVLEYIKRPDLFDEKLSKESEIDEFVIEDIKDETNNELDSIVDLEPKKDNSEDVISNNIESRKTLNQKVVEQLTIPENQNKCIKIIVGHTVGSSREICFEPNNTMKVSHPNLGIIGTMGTGKTQFARSVIAQLSKESENNVGKKPIGILVFDYKGDYKDKEFLDAVGGHAYKFNYPFNPLKLVVNDDIEGMNLPAITADRISDSFAKAYGLGLKQQSNIKQVIIEAYSDKGITKEPESWNNTVPTMEDVIDKYFETYDANDKAYALFDKLHDYTIFTTDNSKCVSLFEWLNSVQVIDLTLYPDDTKKVIVSLILDLFYSEMRQLGGSKQKNGFRELRSMIMVDEAHQFLKKDFSSLRSIISEGRMFGVGMILSTQNISDFKTNSEDYSQFILSWVIHHVNSISKSEIASIFGASDMNGDSYMNFINKAGLFESVCKLGSRVEGMRDLPFFELVKCDERFKK